MTHPLPTIRPNSALLLAAALFLFSVMSATPEAGLVFLAVPALIGPSAGTRSTIAQRVKNIPAPEVDTPPSIFSPEGVMILTWAVILDFLGVIAGVFIILFGIGAVLSLIPDILGIVTIIPWAWFRAGRSMKRKAKRVAKRQGLAAIGELLPLFGILPLWTISVFFALDRRL